MNVAKLNPLGYESKTENGNTYKKSNIGKYIGAGVMATTSILAYTSKNQVVKSLTTATILDTIEQLAKIKISKKMKPVVLGICTIVDTLGGLWIGHMIDKSINKRRIAQADKKGGV